MLKKILKILAIALAAMIAVVGGYVAYVFISYHRLPDMDEQTAMAGEAAQLERPYAIATWNLGFGAYSDDFGFFMDGGTESRARSKEAVYDNLNHAFGVLNDLDPDFMLLQELDTDADRSYHVDEAALAGESLPGYNGYFAQNYDSPYLFYPILRPHGASKAGILTLANKAVERAARRSLPIETGFTKFLDLDRCYSKVWVPVENGKTLVLYNLHLSAYTSDGTIADEQLEKLTADMRQEYADGNYVVGGGDFNKDLLGNSPEVFGVSGEAYTWAQPIKTGVFGNGLTLVDSLDAASPIPSCRNADGQYVPGESFVLTVDGFIVSDNVAVDSCRVIDEAFKCSDHNPVVMTFELKGED